MSFTMFMDRKELAKGGAQMAIDYLTGEKAVSYTHLKSIKRALEPFH